MKPFRYYVHDRDGNIEMEIFYPAKMPGYVSVHYPRIEGFPISSPLLPDRSSFKVMRFADFGYMLFAYSEEEFIKFDAFVKGESMKKENMIYCGGIMTVCPNEKGGYAVRPLNWAGIWDEKGRLKSSCNFTALFREKSDAEEYCKICNDPLAFSSNRIRNELLKHEELWNAFLACIESSLKECVLPFEPEGEIAENVLRRIVGDEEPGWEVSFEIDGGLEEFKKSLAGELSTVDVTGYSDRVILRVLSEFPETENLVVTDPEYYETVKCSKGYNYVPGGDDLLYGRSLIKDFEKKINAAKIEFSIERL